MNVRDLAMCSDATEMCFVSDVVTFRAEYSDEHNLTYEKKKKVNGFLIKLTCMIPKQEV